MLSQRPLHLTTVNEESAQPSQTGKKQTLTLEQMEQHQRNKGRLKLTPRTITIELN